VARFAGLLLVILSVFYTPAATDLDRYRIVAWFAIGSRAAGVLFFMPQATYRMLGCSTSCSWCRTAAAPRRHQQRHAGRGAKPAGSRA
jgi:hypothetical protein